MQLRVQGRDCYHNDNADLLDVPCKSVVYIFSSGLGLISDVWPHCVAINVGLSMQKSDV